MYRTKGVYAWLLGGIVFVGILLTPTLGSAAGADGVAIVPARSSFSISFGTPLYYSPPYYYSTPYYYTYPYYRNYYYSPYRYNYYPNAYPRYYKWGGGGWHGYHNRWR